MSRARPPRHPLTTTVRLPKKGIDSLTHTMNSTRSLTCAAGLLLFVSITIPGAFAQASEEEAVKTTVERFLLAAGNGDLDAMPAMFTAEASIGVVRDQNGTRVGTVQAFDDWLAMVKARPTPTRYEEPVDHFTIHIDHGLAFVRADARLIAGGVVRSHNIDYFTLIKQDGAWKFMNASYIALPPEQK